MGYFQGASETIEMAERVAAMMPRLSRMVEHGSGLAGSVDLAERASANLARVPFASAVRGEEPIRLIDGNNGTPTFFIDGKVARIKEQPVDADSAKAYSQIKDGTVQIGDIFGQTGGTGFLVDPKLARVNGRIVITNDHVVAPNNDELFPGLTVTTNHGAKYEAYVAFRSPVEDLAGLVIPDLGDNAPHLAIRSSSDNLKFGQSGYMGGFPSMDAKNDYVERGMMGSDYTLSRIHQYDPILSSGSILDRIVRTEFRSRGRVGSSSVAEFDHDLPNWRGFSGGALGILEDGQFQVVGVNSMMARARSYSRAVAADYLPAFFSHIAEKGGLPESGYVSFRPDIENWQTDKPAHLDLSVLSKVMGR